MEITGEHRFAAPRSAVWESLLDPAALEAAIPGCQTFSERAPGSYDVTMKVGIAAIKGTYSGTVHVREPEPENSYRLLVEGAGKPGIVRGEVVLHLDDEGDATIVSYRADVRAQGALARLGSRLLGGAAKLMAGQFFKAMETAVQQRVAP